MRLAYFYLMGSDASGVETVAPLHAAYWRSLDLPGYRGGPFMDHSGGLITFEAPDLQSGEQVAAADPFVRNDLISASWMKAWLPDEAPPSPSS
jgi:hypothetical protein